MKKIILFLTSSFIFMSLNIFAQTDATKFKVFDGKGNAVSIGNILEEAGKVDVVFLGEQHDDATAHALQFQIFKSVFEKYSNDKKIALSLEMFERDNQIVLNEYLSGLITEKKFMDDSRPWGNYTADYRPLVELAKANKLEVIAANAPRRYVNMVSRNGREALNALSPEAKKFLPPLPYAEASAAYTNKFKALMGGSPEAMMGLDKILSSQSLWDASMSYWVAESLKNNKNSLIVHLNGAFHTEKRLGTVEHLLKYRPNTKVLVVTMRYEEDFNNFDKEKHSDLGDFVILTDAKQPRSKR